MNATATTQSTGPRTEAGKAASSRNALKTGLFATHAYFVDENEREEYTKSLTSLIQDLQPEGALEETFLAEIMHANWRLRRCRIIEAAFCTREFSTDDELLKAQKSVDRARALSHTILRRSLAELRKLQTERAVRIELRLPANIHPCLADSKRIMDTVRAFTRSSAAWNKHEEKQHGPNADTALGRESASPSLFCNPTQPTKPNDAATPRNAQCPCGSGEKYKRCCGKNAPPQLNHSGTVAGQRPGHVRNHRQAA